MGGVAVDTRAFDRDLRRDFVAPLSSGATPPGHRDSLCFSSSRPSKLSPVSIDVSSSFSFVDSHLRVRSTGLPNYLGLRISVPSALHVPHWRECRRDYPDRILGDYLQFGWPVAPRAASRGLGRLPVGRPTRSRGAFAFKKLIPSPSPCLGSAAVGGVAVDTRASNRDLRRDFVAPLSAGATPPGHRDSFCFSSSRPSKLSLVSIDVSYSFSFVDSHLRVRSTGLPNYLGVRISVTSALHVPHWRECRRDYPDRIIGYFSQFGWPVGFVRDSLPVFDIRTHRGALNFPDMVGDYLAKELRLGRVAGPFHQLPFPDGYVLSPLNTVAKRDSDERRVILDLSWPCGSSVNDGIPSDSFLEDPMALTYPTLDDIVDAIVAAGPGCMLYKRDLRTASRQFPVDPGDYHLLGFAWQGVYYFDPSARLRLRHRPSLLIERLCLFQSFTIWVSSAVTCSPRSVQRTAPARTVT